MKRFILFALLAVPAFAQITNNNSNTYNKQYAVSVVKTNPTDLVELASKAYVDSHSSTGGLTTNNVNGLIGSTGSNLFLTAESDTLATVLARGNASTNATDVSQLFLGYNGSLFSVPGIVWLARDSDWWGLRINVGHLSIYSLTNNSSLVETLWDNLNLTNAAQLGGASISSVTAVSNRVNALEANTGTWNTVTSKLGSFTLTNTGASAGILNGSSLTGYGVGTNGTSGVSTNDTYLDVKRDFGAVGNGSTDDTAALSNALSKVNVTVYFPPGTYRTTTKLNTTNGVKITGVPASSIIYNTNVNTGAILSIGGVTNSIEGIQILGGSNVNWNASSTPGGVNGIEVVGQTPVLSMMHVTVKGCSSNGISFIDPVRRPGRFASFYDVDTENCWRGWNVTSNAEYLTITDCGAKSCYRGFDVAAGNTFFANCSAVSNGYALSIIGTNASSNNSHGSWVGGYLNHSTQFSVLASNVNIGFEIVGVQINQGDVWLRGSSGIHIAGQIDVANLYYQGGGTNIIEGFSYKNYANTINHNYNGEADKTLDYRVSMAGVPLDGRYRLDNSNTLAFAKIDQAANIVTGIVAGANMTITTNGNIFTLAASGSGGSVTLTNTGANAGIVNGSGSTWGVGTTAVAGVVTATNVTVNILSNGVLAVATSNVNFIAGSGVTLTVTQSGNRADVILSSSGTSASTVFGRVNLTTNITVAANGSLRVLFDSVATDTSGSWITNTSSLQPLTTGDYEINSSFVWNPLVAGTPRAIVYAVRTNGVTAGRTLTNTLWTTTGSITTGNRRDFGSATIRMDGTNDVLQFFVFAASSGSATFSGSANQLFTGDTNNFWLTFKKVSQ